MTQSDINAYKCLEQAYEIADRLERPRDKKTLKTLLQDVGKDIPTLVDLIARGECGNANLVVPRTAGKPEYEELMRSAMKHMQGSKRLDKLITRVRDEQQWNGGYRRKSRKSNRRNKRRSYRY
jgi:hypothetical protein